MTLPQSTALVERGRLGTDGVRRLGAAAGLIGNSAVAAVDPFRDADVPRLDNNGSSLERSMRLSNPSLSVFAAEPDL